MLFIKVWSRVPGHLRETERPRYSSQFPTSSLKAEHSCKKHINKQELYAQPWGLGKVKPGTNFEWVGECNQMLAREREALIWVSRFISLLQDHTSCSWVETPGCKTWALWFMPPTFFYYYFSSSLSSSFLYFYWEIIQNQEEKKPTRDHPNQVSQKRERE